MKKRDDMKKMVARAAVFSLVLLSMAGSAFCQNSESGYEYDLGFISRDYRPRWYQPVENYSQHDLRKYPTYFWERETGRQYLSPVTYDQFGNFLLPGGDVYYMQWDQSRAGAIHQNDITATGPTYEIGPTTYAGYFTNVFNNLLISSDEFSNWQTKFMIGSKLRAYFTPSTLKITNFNGIRWDASSRQNSVTLIAQPSSPVKGTRIAPATSTPLWGVHWQSILGDVLKVGGTYVSKQRGTLSDSHQDIDTTIKSGPRYVYLIISDDSPEDTDRGARVYDVKVKSGGNVINIGNNTRVFKIPDLLNRHRWYNKDFQKPFVFQSGSDAYIPQKVENIVGKMGSWFLGLVNTTTVNDLFSKTSAVNNFGYMNLPDPNNPDPNSRLFAADPSQGYLEANGTDIVVYEFLIPPEARDLEFNVMAANDYCIDIIATLYNITSGEEASWDDPPFGPAWSGAWSVQYDQRHGVKAPGNVKDLSNMGWVSVRYDRMTGMNVYGLNMELDWRGLFVRAEFNEYNQYRSYPVPESWTAGKAGYESRRAWFVNVEKDFGRWSVGGEVFDYPREYMQYWAPIDDNDDNDLNVGGSEYPGLDIDWDRNIDTTWSGEPYLLYYFDSVVWGDDFNHNGTIDERENDSDMDLPYKQDSKGQHFFLKIKPRELTLFTVGHYDIEQKYVNSQNLTDYFKFEHMQRLGSMLEFGLFNRSERIQDKYNKISNAWANSSMLMTKLTFIPGLNVFNNFKYNVSNRVGDLSFFGTEDQIDYYKKTTRRYSFSYSAVHKIDYTYRIADFRLLPDIYWRGYRLMKEKRIKEFKFQPMFKFEYSQSSRLRPYEAGRSYATYPIIRFDYRVAPNTLLRCGFQGFPFLPEVHRTSLKRNTEFDLFDYDRQRMVLAFENRSLYQGFNLLVMMGMRRDDYKWIESYGRKKPSITEYFISIRSEATQ